MHASHFAHERALQMHQCDLQPTRLIPSHSTHPPTRSHDLPLHPFPWYAYAAPRVSSPSLRLRRRAKKASNALDPKSLSPEMTQTVATPATRPTPSGHAMISPTGGGGGGGAVSAAPVLDESLAPPRAVGGDLASASTSAEASSEPHEATPMTAERPTSAPRRSWMARKI